MVFVFFELMFDNKYVRVYFMCIFFKNRNICIGKWCIEFVYLSDKLGNIDCGFFENRF